MPMVHFGSSQVSEQYQWACDRYRCYLLARTPVVAVVVSLQPCFRPICGWDSSPKIDTRTGRFYTRLGPVHLGVVGVVHAPVSGRS